MDATARTEVPPSRKLLWAGRIISAVVALFLLFGGVFGIITADKMMPQFLQLGYPARLVRVIPTLMLLCTAVYAIPRTSILGAILLTGYLGGATATHVRIGEPFYAPILVGVLVWLGIYLRDERVRALLPWRK